MKKKFSVVIPVYGNEKNLPVTLPYMLEHLKLFPDYDTELILVCDGSPDHSWQVMEEYRRKYPERIRTARFTRNFGQGSAVKCGVAIAKGDVIGVISADLQDPFELFADMLRYWEQGYKLVIGTRKSRQERGLSKAASKLAHKLIRKLIDRNYPAGGFDFWLMDREVAETYRQIDVPNAFMQLSVLWPGYRFKTVEYERKARKIGKSGYTWRKRFHVMSGVFVNYSRFPLRIFLIPAALSGVMTVSFLIRLAFCAASGDDFGTGIGLLCMLLCLFAALFFAAFVILGEYVWRILYLEQGLPRYIVDSGEAPEERPKEQNPECLKQLVLYGAGGMGAETAYLVEQINAAHQTYRLVGFVVDAAYYQEGVSVNGYPLLGDTGWLLEHKEEVYCVCTVGQPAARRRIQEEMEAEGVRFETLIHPAVVIPPTSSVGNGCVITRLSNVSVNVSLGKGCFLNGPALGHHVKTGDYTVLMPRAQVSGYCEIGEEVMVGACSFLSAHMKIEDKATVAPGSMVFWKVKAGTHVLGNPAHRIVL